MYECGKNNFRSGSVCVVLPEMLCGFS